MTKRSPLVLAPLITLITGCSGVHRIAESLPFVYRVDVQQGNVITQDMLAQLQPGMEKNKVLFIMGTPVIQDTFHQSRWDYIYTEQPGRGKRTARRVSLYFKGDHLERVAGNTRPATGPIARAPSQEVAVEVPRMEPPGFFARVLSSMGIGDDRMRPVTTAPTAVAATAPAASVVANPIKENTVEASPFKPAETKPEAAVSAPAQSSPMQAAATSTSPSSSRAETATPAAPETPTGQGTSSEPNDRRSTRDPTQIESDEAM